MCNSLGLYITTNRSSFLLNTPAHVIFSLALLGRPNSVKYAIAIAIGALLPDSLMLVFYGYEKLRGVQEQIIWRYHYFLPFWQNLFDITNSIPIIAVACGVALYKKYFAWMLMFASMIIHCILDFAVHHNDSHRHFFPFSNYRFQSPVSYWDPAFYGNIVGVIELVLFVCGAIYLWFGEKQNVRSVFELTRLRWVILATTIIYMGFFYFVITTWIGM